MELSKRLQAVADKVTRGSRVADIGCDHGYVSIYLMKSQIAQSVVAMDVNEGPLNRAALHIEREGLSDYIETRLSDGLKKLKAGEADSIICAGMGGRLTVKILSEREEITRGVKELILQPQSEIDLVRNYLCQIGFGIMEEDMILDEGKYYQIIKAKPAAAYELTRAEAKYGPCLIKDRNPVLKEFLLLEQTKYEKILSGLKQMKHEQTGELEEKLLFIQQALMGYADEM